MLFSCLRVHFKIALRKYVKKVISHKGVSQNFMLAGRNFILANADAWTLEAFGKRGTLGTTLSLTLNQI